MEAEALPVYLVYERLSIRTPRVLRHASFPAPHTAAFEAWKWEKGCWYFLMYECPGVHLDQVTCHMSPAQLDHIAGRLIVVLNEMRSCTNTILGSVSGGPCDNRFMPFPWQLSRPFSSVAEYFEYCRDVFHDFWGLEFIDKLFRYFLDAPDVPVHLVHGDLFPCNILVEASTITAIVDWETAGFYLELWEYCRMHEPNLMTPGWAHILEGVYPGPQREEVAVVWNILDWNDPLSC